MATHVFLLENITTDGNGNLISADVSGYLDMGCGDGPEPMVGTIEPCTGTDFDECCPLWGCCQQSLQVEGAVVPLEPEADCPPPGANPVPDCHGTVETLTRQIGDITCDSVSIASSLTGWDPNKDYFRGPAPFSVDALGGAPHDLIVWCDNGTVRWAAITAAACSAGMGVSATGTIDMDEDCVTGTVTEQWTDPENGCCEGGIDRQMTFNQ